MKKALKFIGFITLFQLIIWLIFIGCDLISEVYYPCSTTNFLETMEYVNWIGIPILYSILFLIFENKFQNKLNISKLKLNIMLLIIWIIETSIIGKIVWELVDNNVIYQHHNCPCEIFCFDLNGLEYFLFPWFLAIIPPAIIIIWKIVYTIYKVIKNNTKRQKN